MVRDTDGSAFITKAEFDSLKNNFQNQIDNYNSSIDSKIDGAIAAYLAGIKVSTTESIESTIKNYVALPLWNVENRKNMDWIIMKDTHMYDIDYDISYVTTIDSETYTKIGRYRNSEPKKKEIALPFGVVIKGTSEWPVGTSKNAKGYINFNKQYKMRTQVQYGFTGTNGKSECRGEVFFQGVNGYLFTNARHAWPSDFPNKYDYGLSGTIRNFDKNGDILGEGDYKRLDWWSASDFTKEYVNFMDYCAIGHWTFYSTYNYPSDPWNHDVATGGSNRLDKLNGNLDLMPPSDTILHLTGSGGNDIVVTGLHQSESDEKYWVTWYGDEVALPCITGSESYIPGPFARETDCDQGSAWFFKENVYCYLNAIEICDKTINNKFRLDMAGDYLTPIKSLPTGRQLRDYSHAKWERGTFGALRESTETYGDTIRNYHDLSFDLSAYGLSDNYKTYMGVPIFERTQAGLITFTINLDTTYEGKQYKLLIKKSPFTQTEIANDNTIPYKIDGSDCTAGSIQFVNAGEHIIEFEIENNDTIYLQWKTNDSIDGGRVKEIKNALLIKNN